jgi:NodT family efflux transporter outer membrane factor (OMF) lipoprotein
MKNQSIYQIAAGLLVIDLLASCRVSKDVPPPDTGLPAAYRDMPTDTTSQIADLPWQEFFTDPELRTLIDNALRNNFDLQIAIKNIETSRLILGQIKMLFFPSLGLQIGASTSRPSDNSLTGFTLNAFLQKSHIEDYTVASSLSWEADIWGKIRSYKSGALAEYMRTEEARKVIQTQVISDVAKGYYNLLMLDAQLAIAKRNVLLNDSTLEIIRLQRQAGQVTQLALQQAQAQRLVAAGLVPQFEQQIAIQENALRLLSGQLPAAVQRSNRLDAIPLSDKLGAGVPSDLLSHRPDVKMSELALKRANAEVGFSKASMYPSLTVTAQGGLDAIKASDWFTIPASLFGAVMGGITQPLFQQKKLKTAYETAKINREQTVIRFRQSVLTAVSEVSDQLVILEKLQQQQQLATDRVNTLQDAIQNAQLLFKNGLANYLEVITAQSNVLQSELEIASIKRARLDATVDLYRSVGGGWK